MKVTKDFYLHYAKVSKNPIIYSKYSKFIDDIHKEIVKELYNGWKYKLPHGLGVISIKWFARKTFKKDGSLNLPVNWGLSNKIKKEIEEKGSIPYKEMRDTNGVVSNNGGEKWLIYHDNPKVYSFHWSKGFRLGGITPIIEDMIYYKFKATWHNNRELTKVIQSFDKPEIIFEER